MNHWPSRANPESYRIFTANTLRKKIDLILKNDKLAKIILLGDFNDEPTNKSLLNNLKAKFIFINVFWAHSLTVEHALCKREIRVQFPVGP